MFIKLKYQLTILFLIVFQTYILSQSFIYEEIELDADFVSAEIYDIVQDSIGYIWCATEFGIIRHNGTSMKSFTTEDGLPDNSVLKLFTDNYDRLWFSTYNGQLGYIKNNEVFLPKFNKELLSIFSSEYVYHINVESETRLKAITNIGKLVNIESGEVSLIKLGETPNTLSFRLKQNENGYFYRFNPVFGRKNETYLDYYLDEDTICLDINNSKKSYHINICEIDKNNQLLCLNNSIYLIKDGNVSRLKFYQENNEKNRILSCFYDGGKVWVSFLDKGVHVYNYPDFDNPENILFEDITITDILKDNEENFWFSSFEDGLFRMPSSEFKLINASKDKCVRAIEFVDQNLYYSWYLNGIQSVNIDGFDTLRLFEKANSNNSLNVVYSIDEFKGNLFIAPSTYSKYDFDLNQKGEERAGANYAFMFSNDSLIYEGGEAFYNICDINYNIIYKGPTDFKETVTSICQDNTSQIWLGTLNGLYTIKDSVPEIYNNEKKLFSSRISCIKPFNEGVIVGTLGSGVIIIRADTFYHITKSQGLPNNGIRDIFIDNNSAWIGSNGGLSILRTNVDSSDIKFDIKDVSQINGLLFNEVYDINVFNSNLYIATDNGIVYFNPDSIKYQNPDPYIEIENIILTDNDSILPQNANLKHIENNIQIYYNAISFKNRESLFYRYRLKGYSEEWQVTKNNDIIYRSLPSGDYSFQVMSLRDNNRKGKVSEYNFSIEKHFSEQLVFKVIAILLSLGLIILIIYFIKSLVRINESKKRRLLIAEQNALRLQMNPHFIFNSLGSIQKFILENETMEANEYLTDFASLIRSILECSKHSWILISEEIKCLDLYLKLENVRFNNSINYEIIVADDIDNDTFKIPPLLIQPIVENAIWHGIMNNKRKGSLSIQIKKVSASQLLFTISDDGIGFNESQKLKTNTGHPSTALKNIKERLSILNEINKSNMLLDIIDHSDIDINKTGTSIKLYVDFITED